MGILQERSLMAETRATDAAYEAARKVLDGLPLEVLDHIHEHAHERIVREAAIDIIDESEQT